MIPDLTPIVIGDPSLSPASSHPSSGGHKTAKRAVAILTAKGLGFIEPTGAQRDALLVAFAMKRKVLYGAAFDVVRLTAPVELNDPAAIAANIGSLVLYEIKATNRTNVASDLKGYFFNLTTAELLVAQSLGEQYRFAFVNTVTGEHSEMMLRDVFARARGIYPTWSIKF